jgi:hypothetical protein
VVRVRRQLLRPSREGGADDVRTGQVGPVPADAGAARPAGRAAGRASGEAGGRAGGIGGVGGRPTCVRVGRRCPDRSPERRAGVQGVVRAGGISAVPAPHGDAADRSGAACPGGHGGCWGTRRSP